MQPLNVMALAALLLVCAGCSPPAAPLPTPKPTAQPTTVPTPTPGVALRETFASSSGNLRTGSSTNAQFAVIDGRYQITVTEAEALAWSMFGGTFTNSTIDVEIRFVEGTPAAAAGVIFRMQDRENFYMASLSNQGFYALDACEDGVWRSLIEWTSWPTIDGRGGANGLRVVARADVIQLYLDGKLLDETVDSALAAGQTALSATSYDASGVQVQFDMLSITPEP